MIVTRTTHKLIIKKSDITVLKVGETPSNVTMSGGVKGETGTANASNVAVNDSMLPFDAANVQEAIEKQDSKPIYGGNY